MRNKILLLVSLLFIIGLVSAESSFVFKQNTIIDLKIPVLNSDNSIVSGSTDCKITVRFPDESMYINNQPMTFNAGGIFNYTILNPSQLGKYPTIVSCSDGIDSGFSTFSFEVTPSGFTGTSGFYIIIILLSAGVIVLGFIIKDAPITILGSFGLTFVGLYILFYGINELKDPVYTWAIGIIMIMIAGYIGIRSSYELIES